MTRLCYSKQVPREGGQAWREGGQSVECGQAEWREVVKEPGH